MVDQLKEILFSFLRNLKKAALITLGICPIVAISFLFMGGLTFVAYSERIFWVGLAAMLVGGMSIFTLGSVTSSFGLGGTVRKPGEARKFMDNALEIREKVEKRYDFFFLMWLIGFLCIGVSALVQTVGAAIGAG